MAKRSSRILKTASRQQSAVLLLPMKTLECGRRKKNFSTKATEEDIHPDGLEDDISPDQDWSEYGRIRELGSPLAEVERSAYEYGFSSGKEAAYLLAVKENEDYRKILSLKNDQVAQTLASMMDGMNELQTLLLKEAQEDILAIALAVAQRILGRETEASCERIVSQIEKAITKVGSSEKIVVRLPPLDLERVSEENETFSTLFKKNASLKFEADTDLASGECIVEGTERMVDGRFESQIALFSEVLKETLN